MLAVTFTNKAAKGMLARIGDLPINTRGMWVGTFHGLCNRLLRLRPRDAGLPQLFQILDSQDQLSVVKRVMKSMNVSDEKYPPRQAQWFINANKEAGLRADRVPAFDDFSKRYNEIYAAYDEQCNREGVVDFAELLLRCFELLTANEVLREHYRSRFVIRWTVQDPTGCSTVAEATGGQPRCGIRGGRRRPVHLRLPRAIRPTCRPSSATSGSPGHQAGAELPLPRQHSGCREPPDP